MKKIIEKINECPYNMVDVLNLREPVADYMEAVIRLYQLGLTDAGQTDAIMNEIESAFKKRVQEIRNTLLN